MNQHRIQYWNRIEAMTILERDCKFLGVYAVVTVFRIYRCNKYCNLIGHIEASNQLRNL